MASDSPSNELCELAGQHGLTLDPESLRYNEAGLDYRVVFASEAATRRDWVLRIPRRPDVSAKVDEERRILDFIRPRLRIAVPEWRIASPDLIAYPLLPGSPGLTLDDDGRPVWHFDVASEAYARSLAGVIASLHGIDGESAAHAGVPVETPAQVRQRWAVDLDRVTGEFSVAKELTAGWRRWLDDDDLWPQRTVLTHGELYPAHLLLDTEDRILAALDWTTARVSDPALDFIYQFLIAPEESFAATVHAYEDITGNREANLEARCTALIAAGPLNYALFALQSGEPGHRAAAAAQLDPEAP